MSPDAADAFRYAAQSVARRGKSWFIQSSTMREVMRGRRVAVVHGEGSDVYFLFGELVVMEYTPRGEGLDTIFY